MGADFAVSIVLEADRTVSTSQDRTTRQKAHREQGEEKFGDRILGADDDER